MKDRGDFPGDEISEVLAQQFQMDRDECGPKAIHGDIPYKGIIISSRYSVIKEFDDMRKVIDVLPQLTAKRIARIECDSNAGYLYLVFVKKDKFSYYVKDDIVEAFKVLVGYNGIMINCECGAEIATIENNWE